MLDLRQQIRRFGLQVQTGTPKPKCRPGEQVERLVSPVKPKPRRAHNTDIHVSSASRQVDHLSSANSKLGLPSSQEDFFLQFVQLRKSFSTSLTLERQREIWVELCALDSDGDLPSIDYLRKRVIS
jgi:hypothetical protein